MNNPQRRHALRQRCIQRVDAVGQAVFRAGPWKLPAALALALALPEVWMRLAVALIAMCLLAMQLPRCSAAKMATGSSLPSMDQLRWPALILFFASTTVVVVVFILAVVR